MMTPIEIMALIVAALLIIKLVVIFINPKHWAKVAETSFTKPTVTIVVSLIWSAVVLYFLLQELTIVHIFAVTLFIMPLFAMGFALYAKETTALMNKLLKQKNMLRRAWLVIVIWLVLALWVLYTILF